MFSQSLVFDSHSAVFDHMSEYIVIQVIFAETNSPAREENESLCTCCYPPDDLHQQW